MSDKDKLFEFWENTAKAYQQAFSSWQTMLSSGVNDISQMFIPWQSMNKTMQIFSEQISQIWVESMSDTFSQEINKKNFGMFKNLDQKALAFFQKMTKENFALNCQKILESSAKLVEEAKGKDATVVVDFWQTMLTEYLKDIEAIPDNTKKVNLEPIMQISNKIAKGEWDQNLEKYSQRLWESLKVKLEYGMEYYADPEKTKVGLTKRELAWQSGKVKLYRYRSSVANPHPIPLLIVYSLINRPYILDLLPGSSLIEYYLQNGIHVYLIDWGEPDYEDCNTTLDDLIEPCIFNIVEFILKETNATRLSLMGHCLGGVLALLYVARHPEKVDRFLALTTPITGTQGGIVGLWAHLLPVDSVIEAFGNMPAKLIRYTFIGLKPYYEVIRWKKFYEKLDSMPEEGIAAFHAIDKWVNDNIDVPGQVFKKIIQEIYQEDRLHKGETKIHGTKCDLKKITCPVLNIYAEEDWIVTPKSASVLNDLVGSEKKTLRPIPGQHLSILLDPRNRKIWKEMVQFFCESEK